MRKDFKILILDLFLICSSILLISNAYSTEYTWKDYRVPFTYAKVCHDETASINVDIPGEFIRKNKKLKLTVEVTSQSQRVGKKTGFHSFAPYLRINDAFLFGTYTVPVKDLPKTQEHEIEIKSKYLKPGKNTLELVFQWRKQNANCTAPCCGFTANKLAFNDASLPSISKSNKDICNAAIKYSGGTYIWETRSKYANYSTEAKKRGFTPEKCAKLVWKNPTPKTNRSSAKIKNIQKLLNELDYNSGPADGVLGSNTKRAIIAFQALQNGYAGNNGEITDQLIAALNVAVQNKKISPQEITTTSGIQPTPINIPPQEITTNSGIQPTPIDIPPQEITTNSSIQPTPTNIPRGKRVALVIGNSSYTNGALRNPKNDARLMTKTLETIGFDVTTQLDSTYLGMKKGIVSFGRELKRSGNSTIGLVFYAGHGIQAKGNNYLIPVDAEIEDESDLDISAVDASWILDKMDVAQNDLNFLILDACRNNPFTRSFRSASLGLSRMEAPRGTMIAYATRPGDLAIDGASENSPYTLALSKAMITPGLSANAMFITARNQVMKATDDKQIPWEEGGLTSLFYFAGRPN